MSAPFLRLTGLARDFRVGATTVNALRGIDLTLHSGEILAVWNHNPGASQRNPFTAAISKDEGETWSNFKNIQDKPGDAWAYPAVTWVDNRALLTYFNYTGGLSLWLESIPADWFLK